MGGLARLVLLAMFSAGVCLVGIELLITAVALPRIIADLLDADWRQLRGASWIVNGYLVAYIATMPLAGRVADRFGLVPLFVLSLLVFAVGSALAGAAQDLPSLIAARVVQGAGGGAVVPLATAAASHLYGGHARARALGVIAAVTFLGMALGPFLGAAILEVFDLTSLFAEANASRSTAALLFAASWRWIFYLGAPVAVAVALLAVAAGSGWRIERHGDRIDLLGAALFTSAVASGLTAITWLGSEDAPGGEQGRTVLAGVAVASLALAVLRFLFARDPFLDLRAFRDRVFGSAVLVSLLTGYALATAIVGVAVFVDRVRYGGPDEQRVALGALAGAMAAGALVAGVLLRWFGPVLLSLVGLALGAGGLVLLSSLHPATPLESLLAGGALFGLGFGLTVTPRSSAAVEALGRRAYGMASAGVTVARMLGMAVGLAVLTVLGSNRIQALSVVLVDAEARDAVLPLELRGRPLYDGLVVDALERWASGEAAAILSGLFLAAAAVMAVTGLPALLMGRRNAPDPDREPAVEDRDDITRVAPAV